MELFDSYILSFFNKVIITLSDLTSDGTPCHIDHLINHCKSVVHYGQIGDYDNVIKHCKNCGFIQIKNKMVNLTVLGQKFLDSNREHYFEINEAQKNLITEKVVFKGHLSNHARALFEIFNPNFENETYELSVADTILYDDLNPALFLFKHLGIIKTDGNLFWVDKKYSELVYHLTADRKAISEQQLEKILMENRKLGAQAEKSVVDFEKKRLIKLGKPVQADLVKRISTLNTAAGYDIESFDGETDDITPNRFIEVKATISSEFRFYWSHNERKVANRKKETYWIYLIRNFKDNGLTINPIMINNPEETISKYSSLTITAQSFLIQEESEINLLKKNIDEIEWYHLD